MATDAKPKKRGNAGTASSTKDVSLASRGASTASTMATGTDGMLAAIRAEVKVLQAEIMTEFRATAKTMCAEFVKEVNTSLTSLKETVTEHTTLITGLETSQNDVTTRLELVEEQCAALVQENAKLSAAIEFQQNFSRRQNIKIIGLPETEGNDNPTAFVGPFLKELLGENVLAKPPVIDRAHRTLAEKPGPGSTATHAGAATLLPNERAHSPRSP